MTENNIKEALSECFVNVIASNKGYKIKKLTPDDGGVDIHITYSLKIELNGAPQYVDSEDTLHFQLKATTEKQLKRSTKFISYKLRVSNYDKLIHFRQTRKNTPCFLVLFILPDEKEEWLKISNNYLMLKKHAYWYIPAMTDTIAIGKKKTDHVSVNIPITNKFDVETIGELFKNYVPR